MALKPLKQSKRTRNQRKEDARHKREPWQALFLPTQNRAQGTRPRN
jgi:hypothetical protein